MDVGGEDNHATGHTAERAGSLAPSVDLRQKVKARISRHFRCKAYQFEKTAVHVMEIVVACSMSLETDLVGCCSMDGKQP